MGKRLYPLWRLQHLSIVLTSLSHQSQCGPHLEDVLEQQFAQCVPTIRYFSWNIESGWLVFFFFGPWERRTRRCFLGGREKDLFSIFDSGIQSLRAVDWFRKQARKTVRSTNFFFGMPLNCTNAIILRKTFFSTFIVYLYPQYKQMSIIVANYAPC